jgi:tetratricopeptide (TPR) repeat protein
MNIRFKNRIFLISAVWLVLTFPINGQGTEIALEEALGIAEITTIEQADNLLRYLERMGHDDSLRAKITAKKAAIYQLNGQFDEAGKEFRRALIITEDVYGQDALEVADVLEAYAGLLNTIGQTETAAALLSRAAAIRTP